MLIGCFRSHAGSASNVKMLALIPQMLRTSQRTVLNMRSACFTKLASTSIQTCQYTSRHLCQISSKATRHYHTSCIKSASKTNITFCGSRSSVGIFGLRAAHVIYRNANFRTGPAQKLFVRYFSKVATNSTLNSSVTKPKTSDFKRLFSLAKPETLRLTGTVCSPFYLTTSNSARN